MATISILKHKSVQTEQYTFLGAKAPLGLAHVTVTVTVTVSQTKKVEK